MCPPTNRGGSSGEFVVQPGSQPDLREKPRRPITLNVMHSARFLGLWLFPLACFGACPDHLAGQTYDWATEVCEVRNETDDYLSPSVQSCVADLVKQDRIGKSPYQNCELNKRYKLEWCSYFVQMGIEKSVGNCLKSRDAIPKDITDGIGN
jgi:hypothetical protein